MHYPRPPAVYRRGVSQMTAHRERCSRVVGEFRILEQGRGCPRLAGAYGTAFREAAA
jgi:hypothetical protein